MANPFVSAVDQYTRTITDERDGETWQVTYRPLSAGDRAVLQDLARMSFSEETDEGSAAMRLGQAQILTLDRAIVAWTLPLSKTRETIQALHPDLFDQVFSHISWGGVPEEPEEADPTKSSTVTVEPSPEQQLVADS